MCCTVVVVVVTVVLVGGSPWYATMCVFALDAYCAQVGRQFMAPRVPIVRLRAAAVAAEELGRRLRQTQKYSLLPCQA